MASYPGGGFVLASAAPEELALALADSPHTALSGELLRLLHEGDPTGPTRLTLDHVHRSLQRTMSDKGFPVPRGHSTGRAGELVLAANPAYRFPTGPVRPAHPADGAGPGLDTCPYRGLAPFGSEDAPYFFGREKPTAALVAAVSARLSADGPLVVVGPSGVGKSSLLRAGLLPAPDRGLPAGPDAARWPRTVITPGEHPMAQLARILADLDQGDPGPLRAGLEAEPSRGTAGPSPGRTIPTRATRATARSGSGGRVGRTAHDGPAR
ncbi:ATP-binding protein [Streptomyces sp. CBMA156]|uniref:ATP-binding protein n=1 Tax=Streptomyces sp. CBMA156 TaxID=1930280 RepID=UPI001661CADF|nr:ATP-binding protein [Streptomyces sp. CBMA156]MBD0673676.1 hypothetical protein [Streptomyces sp. CBMA156]